MTVSSVYPPTSTPGGWYGCFGPPNDVGSDKPVAWPVSGQVPCGDGPVESCCILGDRCLSNGVCQILPVADDGASPLYYGSYCTDPTFSFPECAQNCAVRYMAYCGHDNVWQCGYTDRTHPIGCNISDATVTDSSTFWMVEPTKLASRSDLPATAPTTTNPKYVPTQWGVPSAAASTGSPTFTTQTSVSNTAGATTTTHTPTMTSEPEGLTRSEKIDLGVGIGVGVGVGLPGTIVAIGSIVRYMRKRRAK